MKKTLLFLSAFILSVGMMSYSSAGNMETGKKKEIKKPQKSSWAFLPDVVAKVGKKDITKKEFLETLGNQMPPPNIPEKTLKNVAKQLINNMVDKQLLLNLAETDGVKPSPKLVEKEYLKMMEKMPPNFLDQLKKQLKTQGMTMAEYKSKMVNDVRAQEGMAISTWINDRFASKINVTPEDVQKFYNENKEKFKKPETTKASHILIRPENNTDEAKKAAKTKAEKILARLKMGEDFGKLAELESDCPSGKRNKGSLGEFPRGSMVKEFEKVAFSLEPGQISNVVETKFGYHLIKTEAHNKPAYVELSEVAKLIKENITGKKINEEVEKVLNKEKSKLNVKIML